MVVYPHHQQLRAMLHCTLGGGTPFNRLQLNAVQKLGARLGARHQKRQIPAAQYHAHTHGDVLGHQRWIVNAAHAGIDVTPQQLARKKTAALQRAPTRAPR